MQSDGRFDCGIASSITMIFEGPPAKGSCLAPLASHGGERSAVDTSSYINSIKGMITLTTNSPPSHS